KQLRHPLIAPLIPDFTTSRFVRHRMVPSRHTNPCYVSRKKPPTFPVSRQSNQAYAWPAKRRLRRRRVGTVAGGWDDGGRGSSISPTRAPLGASLCVSRAPRNRVGFGSVARQHPRYQLQRHVY